MSEPIIKIGEFAMSDEALEQRWKDACVAMEKAIVEWWGERCAEFDEDCECCKTWHAFDDLCGYGDTDIVEPKDWKGGPL